jgi:pyruvate dehydrogenase E1 component alpha subunit
LKPNYSKEELIEFEEDVAEIFNAGKVKAPVHLYYGNEIQIIEIFQEIKENDWVFCSWRSHYQALLMGNQLLSVFLSINFILQRLWGE